MLFKQNQELQNFSIDELFKDSSIAKGILYIEKPQALSLKPVDLYTKIKELAQKRYGYELPEKQTDLKCLQNQNNKISLLRDLCLKLGIKLLSHTDKDYILDNDINVV